jgi:hypothetical protein
LLRSASLAMLCLGSAQGVLAEPAPSGRPALWQPQKPTPLAIKVHSAELNFDPVQHAFSVTTRTDVVLPEEAQSSAASATLMIVEHGCGDQSELDDRCDPQRLAFPQLSASIGERTQVLEKIRGGRSQGDQPAAWLLPVHVKKGEPLSLEQRYRVPAVESGERGYGISYLLRGVSAWSKPLGRTTLKLSIPAYSCLVAEPQEIARKSRRVVARDDGLWLELVYEAYQYLPKRDFELYFEPCVVPRDTEIKDCSVSALLARKFYPQQEGEEVEPVTDQQLTQALTPLTQRELIACRDGVFAAYAAYYSEEELKRLPTHPQANRHYTAPLLTAADWDWVRYLDARIVVHKPDPVPAAPPMAASQPAQAAHGCGCQLLGVRVGFGNTEVEAGLICLSAARLRRRFRSRRTSACSRSNST